MSLRFGCVGDNEVVGFARISRLETTMRAVGIEKNESEIVQIISASSRNVTMS